MAQEALDAGMKAYGAGRFEEAQRAFDAAMRAGLPNEQMARLLYYRGLTYRKQDKPALAISDLNGALWMKGGLSDAERQDAVKSRALAYNSAGVADVPPVPQSAFAHAPTTSAPGSSAGAPPQTAAVASAPASAAPAAPTPQGGSGGGVTGFFSNLFSGSIFGGGSSDQGQVTTASISQPPPPAEAGGWGGTTEVAAAHPSARAPEIASPFVTQVAAVDSQPAPAPRASASGKYRLQVASVRTRSEAEALAGLVVGRHGEQLGGRQPEVDVATVGSMGTFYRVRLGPYASAKEPEKLCDVLRSDGFDCLIVTQ
jgi:tetratricopeptide (TPR) repeat protein